ncbi:MAG: GntP family permease, partial [Arenibacter sp.]|nr:GntP family permease [Arenibacter sp.]
MTYLIALVLSLALLIVGIIKIKVHPFFVLLFSALAYGFMTGMDINTIIDAVNNGFGDIMGKIGLIILFGVTIGKVLEKSGGAFVIASKILEVIGSKSIHLAMLITGYILSVPVFADSALLIMNPLNKVLSKKAGVSFAGTTAALALGLTASHTMVPPTPGPIAAAGILGADLGSVMIYGILISSISLIACYFFATKIASRIDLPIELEAVVTKHENPALWKSLLAIVIPILLIVCKSIMDYPEFTFEPSLFKTLISFLGTPV